ncbi:MAG: hypothetical protein ACI4WH_05605 [Oscillospiraceae bacterium]
MKKSIKSLTILVSIVCALSLMTPIHSSATTKEDVIAVARQVGMPENLVQSYISLGANIEVTSEQCDKAISILYNIYGTTNDKIKDDFGVDIPDEPPTTDNDNVENPIDTETEPVVTSNPVIIEIVTTQPDVTSLPTQEVTTNQLNNVVTTTTTYTQLDIANIESDYQSPIEESEFISMSYEEKIEFVNSLPQEEQNQFMSNLTTAERNSIIKQMDIDSKANIVNSIVEAGKSMGYNFSVDELSSDNISLSLRDGEGTLIGVTKFGTTIDDTGKDYTGLILSMLAIIGLSGYGLFKISKKVG